MNRLRLNVEELTQRIVPDGGPLDPPDPPPNEPFVWAYYGSELGEWNDPDNWSNNSIPSSSDELIFPDGTGDITFTAPGGALTHVHKITTSAGWGQEFHFGTLNIYDGQLLSGTFITDGALSLEHNIMLQDTNFIAVNFPQQVVIKAGATTVTFKGNQTWKSNVFVEPEALVPKVVDVGQLIFDGGVNINYEKFPVIGSRYALINEGRTEFRGEGLVVKSCIINGGDVLNETGGHMIFRNSIDAWTNLEGLKNEMGGALSLLGNTSIAGGPGFFTDNNNLPLAHFWNRGVAVLNGGSQTGVNGNLYNDWGTISGFAFGTTETALLFPNQLYVRRGTINLDADASNFIIEVTTSVSLVENSMLKFGVSYGFNGVNCDQLKCGTLTISADSDVEVWIYGNATAHLFYFIETVGGITGTFQTFTVNGNPMNPLFYDFGITGNDYWFEVKNID